MLIFTFQYVNQTLNLRAREISQYQQNSRIKTYYSIKDQEPNIIKPLISFVIPRLKRNYSHILEFNKQNI